MDILEKSENIRPPLWRSISDNLRKHVSGWNRVKQNLKRLLTDLKRLVQKLEMAGKNLEKLAKSLNNMAKTFF